MNPPAHTQTIHVIKRLAAAAGAAAVRFSGSLSGIPRSFTKSVAAVTTACFVYTSVIAPGLYAIVDGNAATAKAATALDSFFIPSSYGRVSDARYFGSKKVVIAIQDLHCHGEVQKNISGIISLFDKKFGARRVYIEGAYGPVNTAWLASIKNRAVRQTVLDGLLSAGKLTGAEYYSVLAQRPDALTGLEDREVYCANLARLGKILDSGPARETALAGVRNVTSLLRDRYYNVQQMKLERLAEKYAAGKIGAKQYYTILEKYCRRLGIDLGEYGAVSAFLQLAQAERALVYPKVARQIQEFVSVLRQRMPYSAYRMLAGQTQEFSNVDLLSVYLPGIAREYGLSATLASAYPELNAYLSYIEASRRLNPLDLVREEKKLVHEITVALADNQSEREVAFLVDYGNYLQEYCDTRISAEDYAYFEANRDRYRLLLSKYADTGSLAPLEPFFSELCAFYRVNVERNTLFIRNIGCDNGGGADAAPCADPAARVVASLPDADIRVAVMGGFHTPGFTKLLEDRKISYLVITPNITQDTLFANTAYDTLAREQSKILFQSFALLALSENPYSEQAKVIAEALMLTLRRPDDLPLVREEANEAIREALAGNAAGVTVEFGIKEDTGGNYRFWLTSHKPQEQGRTSYFMYVPAARDIAGKVRPIDASVPTEIPSKDVSLTNRSGMAFAAGMTVFLAAAGITFSGFIGGGAAALAAGFFMAQRQYIRKAGRVSGNGGLENGKERLEGVLAALPDQLHRALNTVGCRADPSPDSARPARYRNGKIDVNVGLFEQLQYDAPWMASIIFYHELRHARFAAKYPAIAARAGWLEEFIVSWGDIGIALSLFISRSAGIPAGEDAAESGVPALIEVSGDGGMYKYFNPALLPDGTLLARRVLRTTDTSRFHRSEIVRLEPVRGDAGGCRFVSGEKLVDNGEDPRIMTIGGRPAMTYVVPFDDGRKWRSAFVWIDDHGKPVSAPVFLGRPDTNSKNTYIAEMGDGSGRVVVFDRANAEGKPAVQRYVFDNIDAALHPGAGYWEAHPLNRSVMLEAGDAWSHIGFNTLVQRPRDDFAIALVHLTKLVSDKEKYYHTAVVLLDKATLQPLGRPVIIHDARTTCLSSAGDVAGVIYEIGAQIIGDAIVSYAGVGDGSIARFEEPVDDVIAKFRRGQSAESESVSGGQAVRSAAGKSQSQQKLQGTLPRAFIETVLFPLAGAQFAGMWWATAGFAAAHVIAAWIARAKGTGDHVPARRFFAATLRNFSVHLALSAIFYLPYLVLGPVAATAVSTGLHALYNHLLLNDVLPGWLPQATVSGKNGRHRKTAQSSTIYIPPRPAPPPETEEKRITETYLAGLGGGIAVSDVADQEFVRHWVSEKVDSNAWPADCVLLHFGFSSGDNGAQGNWAAGLKREGKIGQYWWVSSDPVARAAAAPHADLSLNDPQQLPFTNKPVILTVNLDYFLVPALRAEPAETDQRIDRLVALLAARNYTLAGVNIARSPDGIDAAGRQPESVMLKLCGRLGLNRVFNNPVFSSRVSEIRYNDKDYVVFRHENNRVTGVKESSPGGLLRALEEKDPLIRIAACGALEQRKDPAAAAALERLIERESSAPHPDKAVMKAAYDAVRFAGRAPAAAFRKNRPDEIKSLVESLGIQDDPEGETLSGVPLQQWAKEHRLFTDNHPSYAYNDDEQKYFDALCDGARSWNLTEVREFVRKYARGIGQEEKAAQWMDNLTGYIDRVNPDMPSQKRSALKRDYLVGRKGPHAAKRTDAPFVWAARGKAFKHVQQEREGRLFGATGLAGMKLKDLPVWPVDEQGNLLPELTRWMTAKDTIPPVAYYRAQKRSLRELQAREQDMAAPRYEQLSLFDFDTSDRALGFSNEELAEIVIHYLGKNPLVKALVDLQVAAIDVEEVAASFVKNIALEVKGVDILNPDEADDLYHYELSMINDTVKALQEKYRDIISCQIKTDIVRGDLMPIGNGQVGYATNIIDSEGDLVLRFSEGILRGTRQRESPREMIDLLVRHEFLEYIGYVRAETPLAKQFAQFIFDRGMSRNVASFHEFLLKIEPKQRMLFYFARDLFESERLNVRIADDPGILASLQQVSQSMVRLLTAPQKRLVFEQPSDILMIGGGSGTGAVIGGMLGHFGNIQSIVSYMDNGGSTGEILQDVADAWQYSNAFENKPSNAIAADTLIPPGDVMSVIVNGIPERWKRDLLMYRMDDAKQVRELLDKAKQHIFETYKEQINRGEIKREKINRFADSLVPIANWVDSRWVNVERLRLDGINHSLQNMIYFGVVFMEGAYRSGWLIPSAYTRAMDRIVQLLGSGTPALPSSLQSFNRVSFVAELPEYDFLPLKDANNNTVYRIASQKIVGQENITGTPHEAPISCVKFLNREGKAVAGTANPEALRMIRRAKCIVIGPGSIYTSILPNLMADGVVEELQKAKERGIPVVFLFNTTQDIETAGHTFASLVASIEKSISIALHKECQLQDFVSYVVMNDATPDAMTLESFTEREADLARQKVEPRHIHEQGKYAIGLFPDIPDAATAFLQYKGIQPITGQFAAFKNVMTKTNQLKMSYHYIVSLLALFFTLVDPQKSPYRYIASDVDETLAGIKQPISDSMAQRITDVLQAGYVFALISGNTRESIIDRVVVPLEKKLGDDHALLKNMPLFANNGSEMYEYNPVSRQYELVKSKITDMSAMLGGDKIQLIKDAIMETIRIFNIRSIRGNPIEVRRNELGGISQITFMPAGTSLTKAEKEEFDKNHGKEIREKYASYMNNLFRTLGIPVSAKVAGKTSIDITPLGVDKAYALKVMAEHYKIDASKIMFIGDSFSANGNDFPAASEAGTVINVGAHIEKLPIPMFAIDESGPEGAERFLAMIGAVRRPPDTEQALGFTRDEIAGMIGAYLTAADPLSRAAGAIQGMAASIADALLAESAQIHGVRLKIRGGTAYSKEKTLLRREILAHKEYLAKLGIASSQENIVIKTVAGDAMPIGRDPEGLRFASMEVVGGKVVFYVTDGFWRASRDRAPPELITLLARHELAEYVYRRENPGATFEDFHRETATEYAVLFDFAATIIIKMAASMQETPVIDAGKLERMIDRFFTGGGYTPGDVLIGRPFEKNALDALRVVLADLRTAAPESILYLPPPEECHITVAAENGGLAPLYSQEQVRKFTDTVAAALSNSVYSFSGSLSGTLRLMPDGVIIYDITDPAITAGVGKIRALLDAGWYKPRIVHLTIGRIRSTAYTPAQLQAIQTVLDRHNKLKTLACPATVNSISVGQFTEQAQRIITATTMALPDREKMLSQLRRELVGIIVADIEDRIGQPGNEIKIERELKPQFSRIIAEHAADREFVGLMKTELLRLNARKDVQRDRNVSGLIRYLQNELPQYDAPGKRQPVTPKNTSRTDGQKGVARFLKSAQVTPRLLKVARTAAVAITGRDHAWIAENIPEMAGKQFVMVAARPDLLKLAAFDDLGLNAFAISYSGSPRGILAGKVLVRCAGREQPVPVEVRAGLRPVGDTDKKVLILSLYSKEIAAENRMLDADNRRAREMQLLGRGALAVCNQLREDGVMRGRIAKLGVELKDDFYPDVIEMSGAGAVLAAPRSCDDEYSDLFDRSLVVYETQQGEQPSPLPEGACRDIPLNAAYVRRACTGGMIDFSAGGAMVADTVIGNAALRKAHPWLDGVSYERERYPENMKERLKMYVAGIYFPGVSRKSPKSWTDGISRMGERILPSALTGHSNRIGKLSDVDGYVNARLIPAGAGMVQLVALQKPGAANLFAGDDLLIDWKNVDGVRQMLAKGTLQPEDVEGQVSDRKSYIDRAAVANAEFAVAEKVYDDMQARGKLGRFNEFAGKNTVWLKQYAEAAAEQRLAGKGGNARDAFEKYRTVYAFMQWIFGEQLKETVAALAKNKEKALFSIDVHAESPAEINDAVRYWFSFGFHGVHITIHDGGVLDDAFFRDIRMIAGNAYSDPLLSVKLPSGASPAVVGRAHENGFVVVRDMSTLGSAEKSRTDEGIEIDSFAAAPRDSNGAQDYYIRVVREATLSHAAFVFFRMGMLWGEEVDIDNTEVRAFYRVPAAGDARHRFDSSFLRRLYAIGCLSRASYADAYQQGLTYPALRRINRGWLESLNGTSQTVSLHYSDGSSRKITAPGLHCLLKAGEILNADLAAGNVAQEYYSDTYFFNVMREILAQPGISADEVSRIEDYIRSLEKDARSMTDRDEKRACVVQLFGFVRGMMENVVAAEYAACPRAVQVNEAEKRILRSLLLAADAAGIAPEEIAALKDNRAGNLARIRAAAEKIGAASGGKGLFTVLIAVSGMMDASMDRDAADVENSVRAMINPLLGELLKNGTMTDAMLDVSPRAPADKAAQQAAITELYRIFTAIAEKRQLTVEDMMKGTSKLAIESCKDMFAAG